MSTPPVCIYPQLKPKYLRVVIYFLIQFTAEYAFDGRNFLKFVGLYTVINFVYK